MKFRYSLLPTIGVLGLSLLPMTLRAQVLSAVNSASGDAQTVDLTADGATDWVQFGVNGSDSGFNLANEKSGGSVGGLDTIGAVAVTGDGATPQGQTQNTSTATVSYSDGGSPASSSDSVNFGGGSDAAGNISIQTNYSEITGVIEDGSTLSFGITFNQAISTGTITLLANSYGVSDARLTLSLSNASGSPVIFDTGNPFGNENDTYTISVANIAAGSQLNFSYDMVNGANQPASSSGGYDNISLEGVAVELTATPEPSTYFLLLGGTAALLVVARLRPVIGSKCAS